MLICWMLNQVIQSFWKLITQLDEIIIRDQTGTPLEIEDKVNLTLLISK